MPVLEASNRDMSAPMVGETEFIDPDNAQEQVKLYIHMAQPVFLDQQLEVSSYL